MSTRQKDTLSMKIARAKCMQCIPVVAGCLLLMLSSNVRGDLNDWEELPLHGGEIHHGIEIDPNDPSHMFCIVGTGEKEGGGGPSTLYESKNSAETWEKVQVIPPYNGYPDPFNIDFLRYAPSNETTIYAGRIRSFDNGATWETMPNVPGWVIGIDPENEQVLYAAQRGEMFTYVDLLFKSQNGGDTWTTLGLQLDNTNVRDFLINYDNPDVLIAAAWTIDKGLALKEGLYLSEDGGLNWTWIFWNWPFSVKQHITNPSMLFIGAAKEFYRASDYSEFWTMWDVVFSTKRVKCVLTHPSLSNRIYAFSREGAYTSSDTGLSFTKKAAFPTRAVSGAVDDSGTSTILYTGCSHGVGVWRSEDEGETWIEKSKGIRDNEVWDIKEDPEDSSTLYVATDKGIARLDIESDKDIQLLTDFDYSIGCLAFDSFDPSLIVTLLWPNRISRSTDKGLTWSESTTFRKMIGTPLPLMADCVYASKETPQRFLVGTRNSFYGAERGIYKSLDGGQTFVTTPVLELAVTCMESGIYDDGYMCFAGVKDDDRGGVYKSMDDGETWVDTGLSNLAVSTLAGDPDDGNRVYVAGNIADTPSMYRSTDCGATWVECTPPFDLTGGIRDIELDPCHPSHLFVSVESAIYESTNGGQTWKVFSDGLENVRALYVVPGEREPLGSSGGHVSQEPPLSQDVFAGTNGGLFRCVNPQLWNDDIGADNDWTWWATDNVIFNAAVGTHEQMPGTQNWALALRSWDTEAGMGNLPALCYGYWQSPSGTVIDRVPYLSDTLYKVKWQIAAGHDNAQYQPGLRFRIMTGASSCGGDMVIQEFGGYKPLINTDVNNPTEIDHYWYPPQWLVNENVSRYPDQAGLVLYAEMFDNRAAATGKYWIPRVEVYALEPPAQKTPVFNAPPFEAGAWRDTTRRGDVTSSIDPANGVTIDFPSTPTTEMRYCFWEFVDPAAPLLLEANKLYRATYTVTSSGETPPVFRQRMIVRNLYLGAENVITPTVPQGYIFDYAIPGSTPRELVCYLPIGDQFLSGDDLLFSMDVYGPVSDIDPYEGSYTVTDIKVEALDMP